MRYVLEKIENGWMVEIFAPVHEVFGEDHKVYGFTSLRQALRHVKAQAEAEKVDVTPNPFARGDK